MSVRVVVRRVALVTMLLGGFLGAWTVGALLDVRTDLNAVRDGLEEARAPGQREELRPLLRSAQSDLQRSVDRLALPGPAVVASLPLIGRPVRAVDQAAEAALAVVGGTADAVDVAAGIGEIGADGRLDLAAMADVADALERAAERSRGPVEELLDQPLGLVPSAVSGPTRSAQDVFAGAPDAFARAAAGIRGVTAVLGAEQPRRLLIMLENNAELRGTGGLATVFAEATAVDGRLEVGTFRDVEDVADIPSEAVPVEAPEDYRELWGTFLANTTLWKNVNMSPDVPTSSAVLSRIAATSLGAPPDVVVWFDVPAVAALLRATGPTELPTGGTLTADNAVDVLLAEAYEGAVDTREGQAQRRTALREAADAVIGAVLNQQSGNQPTFVDLATALDDAALGRHLALWSGDPEVQADLLYAGLAADVSAPGDDLFSFAVQNLGGGDAEGNKLDYYARRRVSVDVALGHGGALVEQEVVLRNEAPAEGLPAYVAGGGTPGATNNLVSLAVPAAAEVELFTRGNAAVLQPPRPQGDHLVVTDFVSLQPGTETTWRLRYWVPDVDGDYSLRLIPQPLAYDAELDVRITPQEGHTLRAPAGSALVEEDDALVLREPFSAGREIDVTLSRQSLRTRAVDAFRRFWTEPVSLP